MREALRECANWLKAQGVRYADCRYVHREHEAIRVTDLAVDSMSRATDAGVGIRVLVNGGWGFAATAITTPAALKKSAAKALQIARASATVNRGTIPFAEQEAFVDVYRSACRINPFDVSTDDKIDLLLQINKTLKKAKQVRTAEAYMDFYRTNKLFVSTEGADIEQRIIESGAGYRAIAFDGKTAQVRSYPNSHGGSVAALGYEHIQNMGMMENAERIREEAVSLLKASPCPYGETTIIISAPQLALQVHESCGHPIELDRVLGTEISLAGGSFLTIDKLGHFKYGSDIVNITADATIEGALGTFGYDDEGVKAQRTPIIRNGVFSGYLTSRETAPVINQRSNGAMRADGFNRIPLIRMTNINLEPGNWTLPNLIADTKDGILLDVNRSWSIDDKRLNFQFGVECGWQIKNGKIGQIYKDPIYTGITPEFWNSCDAICNKDYWQVWGVPNCGKGEPTQTMHVAHGTAPARFRNVTVGVKS